MIDIVGKEQLEEFIWENVSNKKITVIYFGAEWCGPCNMLKNKIKSDETISAMPNLVVAHVDVDEDKNGELCELFNVKALPTQIFVTLNGPKIVELKKVNGFNWGLFENAYKDVNKNFEEVNIDSNKVE